LGNVIKFVLRDKSQIIITYLMYVEALWLISICWILESLCLCPKVIPLAASTVYTGRSVQTQKVSKAYLSILLSKLKPIFNEADCKQGKDNVMFLQNFWKKKKYQVSDYWKNYYLVSNLDSKLFIWLIWSNFYCKLTIRQHTSG
jgi:hypothetical protein